MALALLRAAYVQKVQRRLAFSPSYVKAGLTAYWDSTKQTGSESGIPDSVGGFDMTHANGPTYDATTKLWTYNGTNQRSLSGNTLTPIAATGGAAGLFTLEGVFALHATTPNFSRPLGVSGSGGGVVISNSTLNCTWSVTGATATSVAPLVLDTIVHVAIVGRGTTLDLYANGTKKTGGVAWTVPTLTNQIAFFGDPSGSSQWTNGKAGWMRYYAATALSDAQVAQNYRHAKTVFPALP